MDFDKCTRNPICKTCSREKYCNGGIVEKKKDKKKKKRKKVGDYMLNVKQEKFIQNIINGMSQRQAYKDAYNAKYSDKAIDEKASTLFNSEKVQKRYVELLKELEDKSIMSAKERMIWLTEVINNIQREEVFVRNSDGEEVLMGSKNADLSTKIKALDTLNKMSGEYTTNIKGNLTLTYEEAIKKVSGTNEY